VEHAAEGRRRETEREGTLVFNQKKIKQNRVNKAAT
jgi:hypothetical protein